MKYFVMPGLLVFLLLLATTQAQAAELQVSALEVVGGGAQPVVGARVCLNKPNEPVTHTAIMTGTTGMIAFQIDPGEWVVTISADGFRGQQRTVTVSGTSTPAAFSMERCTGGDCGPTCLGTSAGKTLSVEVRDGAGLFLPVGGAKVCVGTSTSTYQYGAALTGSDGKALISGIPNDAASAAVTVVAQDYQRVQQIVDLSQAGADATVSTTVPVLKGSGGPECRIKLNVPDPGPVLRINNFQINRGMEWTAERRVGLFATYEGNTPTHYQVSESPQFVGAAWKEFQGAGSDPVNYPFAEYDFDTNLSPRSGLDPNPGRIRPGEIVGPVEIVPRTRYGNKTLYLRFKNNEAMSATKSDSIELRPRITQYAVSGENLKTLLRNARDEWGFSFRTNISSTTFGNTCPQTSGVDKIDFDRPGLQMGLTGSTANFPATKTVEYHFFEGRNLNPYWQITGITFAPDNDYNAGDPAKTSFSVTRQCFLSSCPHYMVRISYTGKDHSAGSPGLPGSSSLCFTSQMLRLMLITLDGPEGAQWQDAFRRD